jgi:hypothetical protein
VRPRPGSSTDAIVSSATFADDLKCARMRSRRGRKCNAARPIQSASVERLLSEGTGLRGPDWRSSDPTKAFREGILPSEVVKLEASAETLSDATKWVSRSKGDDRNARVYWSESCVECSAKKIAITRPSSLWAIASLSMRFISGAAPMTVVL